MTSPLLQVRNLDISFPHNHGRITALKNISFHLNRGEVFALVGESGSGKSLSALSILRLLPPTASIDRGEILFHPEGQGSVNIADADKHTIRRIRGNRIAMIFQEPMTSLNPVMRCGHQVAEAIRLHKNCSKKEARLLTYSLFEKVQLPDPQEIFQRYPHQISGGQKQRIMIAMAMSAEPDILIADEPTTALDVTVQKNILGLIRSLQKETSMGVIFITHDLGVVAELADRVAVMYKGEIVEEGFAGQILSNPGHPYTKALMACRPALHPKNQKLPVISDFLLIREDHKNVTQPQRVTEKDSFVPAEPDILLKACNLVIEFPTRGKNSVPFRAVDNVSLEVRSGEMVGLVGESGCGKTTLGRALLGLIPLSGGHIEIKGRDTRGFNSSAWRNIRKEIQIVFQDPYGSLNPRLSVGSAIAEPMRVHGIGATNKERKELAVQLLEKVNLKADHFSRYPHEFSGGQRQRIGIARALSLSPDFIVFDESVSALDVSVQAQVLNLLSDLRQEYHFCALFISHDLSVVHYISDRILVMHRGIIVESGNASDIFYNPREEYTKNLVAAIPGKNPGIHF